MNAVLAPVIDHDALLREALKFEGILRACLYRYTRNRADVDELLQDVYAALLTCHTQPHNVRAFALTVARNTAFDWLRHKQVVPLELLADVEKLETLDESALIEEVIESQQELERFVWATRRLPRAMRQVFVLKKIYGHSQAEIAQRLGITENTVEVQMTRAARKLAWIFGMEAGMKQ